MASSFIVTKLILELQSESFFSLNLMMLLDSVRKLKYFAI